MAHLTRLEFEQYIIETLESKPEWLSTAIQAICVGAARVLENEKARSGQRDMALRCALSLIDKKRLEPRVKELLNAQIVKALPDEGGSEIEKNFIAKRKK